MIGLEGRNVLRTAGKGVMDFQTTERHGVGSVTLTAPGMGSVTILVTAADATRMSIAAGRLAFDCTMPPDDSDD